MLTSVPVILVYPLLPVGGQGGGAAADLGDGFADGFVDHGCALTVSVVVGGTVSMDIIIQPEDGLCGQTCVAMLAGVPLADVVALMGKEKASWSKILEALDYYGISYADKMDYPKGKAVELPECCIVYNDGRFLLWFDGGFYGAEIVDAAKTVSYREIIVSA